MAKAIPTPPSTHILPALALLRKPLFGLAKRQLPVTLCDSFAQLNEIINLLRK